MQGKFLYYLSMSVLTKHFPINQQRYKNAWTRPFHNFKTKWDMKEKKKVSCVTDDGNTSSKVEIILNHEALDNYSIYTLYWFKYLRENLPDTDKRYMRQNIRLILSSHTN